MPARITAPVDSPYVMKAILALDPAGAGDSGIAVRLTATLPQAPKRGKLTCPDFLYQGSIWNDVLFDELGVFLAKHVGRTGPILMVAEDAAFGSMSIARSIGTAIGAMRSFLVGTGWMPSDQKPLMVSPAKWRRHAFPVDAPKGRAAQKEAAVTLVSQLYGVGDERRPQCDLAEAVLICDYATCAAREDWQ